MGKVEKCGFIILCGKCFMSVDVSVMKCIGAELYIVNIWKILWRGGERVWEFGVRRERKLDILEELIVFIWLKSREEWFYSGIVEGFNLFYGF